jgi:Circularly permutated YpsA SLOG family
LSPLPPTYPESNAELREVIRRTQGTCVLTGGQTGVDTIAARAALSAGLPVQMVFPSGFRQEDGPLTAARRRALRGATLHELDSADFRDRTWTCVNLADAVILIDPAGGDGCEQTGAAARSLSRPLLVLGTGHQPARQPGLPAASSSPGLISSFFRDNAAQVVMVAGCRASLLAGQHKTAIARALVGTVLSVLTDPGGRVKG